MSPLINKFNVLVTDRFDFNALSWLKVQPELDLVVLDSTVLPSDPPDLELSKAQALIVRSKTEINESLLKRAPQLKIIVSCTAGFDHIDLLACQKAGVQVMVTPDGHTQSAAELTIGLMIGCSRWLPKAHEQVIKGSWDRQSLTGTELCGKTLGIVGLGRIGKKVTQIAQAIGLNVIAFDPYIDHKLSQSLNVKMMSYQELLLQSHIISFHVPKSKETTHMLRASNLEDIDHGVIIVNTSRGDVIDALLLQEGLKSRVILAAGLDVFHKEPLPKDSPILKYQNCLFSPHIGATTTEALSKVSWDAAYKVINYVKNQSVTDTLPPNALWYTNPMGFSDQN